MTGQGCSRLHGTQARGGTDTEVMQMVLTTVKSSEWAAVGVMGDGGAALVEGPGR